MRRVHLTTNGKITETVKVIAAGAGEDSSSTDGSLRDSNDDSRSANRKSSICCIPFRHHSQ